MNEPISSSPTPPLPSPPRPAGRWTLWRVLGLILFIGGGVLVVLAAANTFENWRASRAWAQCRQQLESRGEKLDMGILRSPSVPPEQNFIATPLLDQALRTGGAGSPIHAFLNSTRQGYPAMGNWQKGQRTDLAGWAAYYRAGTNYPVPETSKGPAADVLTALSRYDRQLAELREAAQRPHAFFPDGGGSDFLSRSMNHLALVKGTVSALNIHSVALLAAGRSDEALQNLRVAWRFDDALRSKPLILAMLVRIAVNETALVPVWEGLADHRWNEGQLAAIEQALARVDFVGDFAQTLRGERAFMNASFDQMIQLQTMPHEDGSTTDGAGAEPVPSRSLFSRVFFPAWMIKRNQLVANQFMQDLIENLGAATTNEAGAFALSPEVTNRWAQRFNQRALDTTLSRPLWESMNRAAEKAPRAQATIHLARTAVAIERYRLANGSYPEELELLKPKFFTRLPLDPFTGKPLKYRRDPMGGYSLYSVGCDRADDGGAPESSSRSESEPPRGDVVWRQP